MVFKILSNLSPTDLLSCTWVNSTWEGEARKHLLNLAPTGHLCCSTVDSYIETMSVRDCWHSCLKVTICDETDCLSILVNKLREANCLSKVTSLSTDWVRDVESDFLPLASFCNLKTLELCFNPQKGPRLGLDDISGYFGVGMDNYSDRCATRGEGRLSFPSVTEVVWQLPEVWMQDAQFFRRTQTILGPFFLPIFPNVGIVRFIGVSTLVERVMISCNNCVEAIRRRGISILVHLIIALLTYPFQSSSSLFMWLWLNFVTKFGLDAINWWRRR